MTHAPSASGVVTFVLLGNESGGTRASMLILLKHLRSHRPVDVVALSEGEIVRTLRGMGLHLPCIGANPPRVLGDIRSVGAIRWLGRVAWNAIWVLHRGCRLTGHLLRHRTSIGHTNMGYTAVVLLIARVLVRFRYLCHWRCIGVGRDMRPFVSPMARWVDRFIAVSEAARLSLPARWQVKTSVIYNFVEVDRLADAARRRAGELRRLVGVASTTPLIVCVGAYSDLKGQHRLVEAMAGVNTARGDVVCVLIGSAVQADQKLYLADMKARVTELRLDDCVRFLTDHSDAAELLADATVSVVTTRQPGEGFGLVMVESMACGVPVVAFDAGAASEVVDDRKTGRLVADGDVDGLARTIVEVLADPQATRAMGEAGRARAAAFFRPEPGIQNLRKLLDDLDGTAAAGESKRRGGLHTSAGVPRIG